MHTFVKFLLVFAPLISIYVGLCVLYSYHTILKLTEAGWVKPKEDLANKTQTH